MSVVGFYLKGVHDRPLVSLIFNLPAQSCGIEFQGDSEGANIWINFSNVSNICIPCRNPWGKNDAVLEIKVIEIDATEMLTRIILQSGDEIEITSERVSFPEVFKKSETE